MTNSPEQTRPAVAQRNERYARGMETLRAVSGDRATEFIDSLSDIAVDPRGLDVRPAIVANRRGMTRGTKRRIRMGNLALAARGRV